MENLREKPLRADSDTAELIRELRKRAGMTQEKFAARLGVTYPTINRWENRRTKPSPLALRRLEELVRRMGDQGADLRGRFFAEEA